MSFFDRLRSPDSRERHERERAEQDAQRQRATDAARLREEEAQAAGRYAVIEEALGPDLAAFEADTPAQAKIAIKMARLRKRELQAEKREIAAGSADEREAWRERQAGRYYLGGLPRRSVMRQGIQGKRRAERLTHAATVNAASDAKQEIDNKIAMVDRLLLELERKALG